VERYCISLKSANLSDHDNSLKFMPTKIESTDSERRIQYRHYSIIKSWNVQPNM